MPVKACLIHIPTLFALLFCNPALCGAVRPNILFILADDLGWRDLGCYGSTFHETPHLDRLASEGLRFTQAYTAGAVCSPTRGSIMTGKVPVRTGVTDYIPGFPPPAASSPPSRRRRNSRSKKSPSPNR